MYLLLQQIANQVLSYGLAIATIRGVFQCIWYVNYYVLATLTVTPAILFTPRVRMRSRGKVIGLYVAGRRRRHQNRQFSTSTCLCVMYLQQIQR